MKFISRLAFPYKRCLVTNYATNGYPTFVPTTTQPSGDGVFSLCDSPNQQQVPQDIEAIFFGAGSAGNTFLATLLGWKQLNNLWVPVPLFEVTVTLGADTGVQVTPTGDTTNGSNVIKNVSSFTGVAVGNTISGTGIPSAVTTTITAFDSSQKTITLSANATATNAGTTLTIADVPSAQLFAKTIALTSGYANTDPSGVRISSVTANIAHLVAAIHGFSLLQWIFSTGGVATSCNGMWAET